LSIVEDELYVFLNRNTNNNTRKSISDIDNNDKMTLALNLLEDTYTYSNDEIVTKVERFNKSTLGSV